MTRARGHVAAGQALAIGAVATFAHLAVFLTVILFFHVSIASYSDKGDGLSYKHMAAALLGDRTALDEYDTRVFPGYSAMIAIVHEITRLSLGASALLITFTSAGIAAAGAAVVFGDRRVGWAVALILPHAWINMSMAMSEAPMLALELLGILLVRRDQVFAGGMIFGLALLTRPVAGFALAGLMLERFARDRGRRGVFAAIVAAVMFFGGMYMLRSITGGFLAGIRVYANSPRAYAGQLITWPFHSILWMTFHGNVGWGRWIYVMAHVLVCLGGCLTLSRRNSPMDQLAFIWLLLNTLLVLCLGLGPGAWGFYHFPRFTIPALPALAWSWRRFLPASPWLYIPLSAALFAVAIIGVRDCP